MLLRHRDNNLRYRLRQLLALPKRSIKTTSRIVRFRGLAYLGYLLTGYLLPKWFFVLYLSVPLRALRLISKATLVLFLLLLTAGLYAIVQNIIILLALLIVGVGLLLATKYCWAKLHLWWVLKQAMAFEQKTTTSKLPTKWDNFPVSPEFRKAVDSRVSDQTEIVLAHIDQDGCAFSQFGQFPYMPLVSQEDFIPRKRYDIDVVLRDSLVLVRKDYRGDRLSFAREWRNLVKLG